VLASISSRSAWLVGGLMAVLSAAALTACGDDGDQDAGGGSATNGRKVEITLASPAPNSLFTFNDVIARELGFYEQEGLEVKTEAVADDIPIAGLVQNGKADVGLVAATDAITAATKTDELRVPYDERTGGNGFIIGIVVPEDSDVKTAADLKGKNVGLASPDQDRAYLAGVLDAVGLTTDDVETTVVGPGGPSVAQTLRSGRIAAYAGTLNDFFAFDEAGVEVHDITPEGFDALPVGGYIVSAKGLEEGDALVRFFRALAKGTYVGIERPKVAEAVSRKVAPEEWREPELSRGLLEALTETLVPFEETSFGEVKPDRWDKAQQLLKETGVIESTIDINGLVTSDHVQQINEFDRKAALAEADAWLAQNSGK
jgi:ABC-type nitrate/sulfonate/bicarbonate transport system substrate-binding protein